MLVIIYQEDFFLVRLLRGALGSTSNLTFWPQQFPTISSIHMELMTLTVWVLFRASETVGLSLLDPFCRIMPKCFSSISWFNLALRKIDTPGIDITTGSSSMNAYAVIIS